MAIQPRQLMSEINCGPPIVVGGEARRHSLERTSPKGESFVGVCVLCGESGLTAAAARLPCRNPHGVTEDEAVVNAIEGPESELTVNQVKILKEIRRDALRDEVVELARKAAVNCWAPFSEEHTEEYQQAMRRLGEIFGLLESE